MEKFTAEIKQTSRLKSDDASFVEVAGNHIANFVQAVT